MSAETKYDRLKLGNQLCFPMYAAAKEIVGRYKSVLDELDLTYTQYISMLVLWEHGTISVRDMGKLLYLDSGTLTPLLKKLEQKGFVERKRDPSDERVLNVSVTEKGISLREEALAVPGKIACTIDLTQEEVVFLFRVLHKLLGENDEIERRPLA